MLFSVWLVWNISRPLRHMLSKWTMLGHIVTWRLGAMLQELPVQEWMLQWYVLRRCAQVHSAQWRLQLQHLYGCVRKLCVPSSEAA